MQAAASGFDQQQHVSHVVEMVAGIARWQTQGGNFAVRGEADEWQAGKAGGQGVDFVMRLFAQHPFSAGATDDQGGDRVLVGSFLGVGNDFDIGEQFRGFGQRYLHPAA